MRQGGRAAPGKAPASPACPRLCRFWLYWDPHGSQCGGLEVITTPASTFSSAPLCKSCVCCHFRGPQRRPTGRVHFRLRVMCRDGAGSPVPSEGGWHARGVERAGEYPGAGLLLEGCWGKETKTKVRTEETGLSSLCSLWRPAAGGFLSHDSKSRWGPPCSRQPRESPVAGVWQP